MVGSDQGEPVEVFTRTHAEFGADAIVALEGVLKVLQSLEDGYEALNRHPPLNNFVVAMESVQELIAFTQSSYIE